MGLATPIDSFVLSELKSRGLTPAAAADKRTLLRRVHFDLTGLPPTPEEMAAFQADETPDAYEKIVDRLLASPRHGERWARHWMDVVHYAETHGHDQDRPRHNAWPYRDFLIRSFNSDLPYATFVQQQIAGDVLWPEEPLAIAATGLLATGPWDESSLQSIREDTIDRQIARYIDRDDILTTVVSTFLSTTVHCARCHDHKFDPIPQKDYYNLQAVFAATDKAERASMPFKTAGLRKNLLAVKERWLRGKWTYAAGRRPGGRSRCLRQAPPPAKSQWRAADVADVKSAEKGNARPAARRLDSGKRRRPRRRTRSLPSTDLQGITGIRLEVLTDPSLPSRDQAAQRNNNAACI